MYNSIVVSDFAPVAVVALVAVIAALPAYITLRRAKRGRARSAVAYLMGFFAGLLATAALAAALQPFAAEATPVAVVGMIASFVGPFVGMAHAKLREPVRRKPRSDGLQWGFPR